MKYFSLFAGIGGLDWGAKEMGFECVGFSEIKPSSVNIFRRNYGNVINYGDITKIVPGELPDFDMLFGGFPFQSFSIAGLRRGLNDPRGVMIFYIYNILIKKRPRYFVLENVRGILSHDGGKTYIKVHKLLRSAGYNVGVLLLNALDYGSAQSRERVLFLGSLDECDYDRPVVVDRSRVFKDIRDSGADDSMKLIEFEDLEEFDLELIGDYDRVGTLVTSNYCGNKNVGVGDKFRKLSVKECERLQGFSDGWTDGESDSNRYWALGNAVSCDMSNYLFGEYLKDRWY